MEADRLNQLIYWADRIGLPDEIIPRDKKKLAQLEELNLSDYLIDMIPEAIGALKQLRVLNLSLTSFHFDTIRQKKIFGHSNNYQVVYNETESGAYEKQEKVLQSRLKVVDIYELARHNQMKEFFQALENYLQGKIVLVHEQLASELLNNFSEGLQEILIEEPDNSDLQHFLQYIEDLKVRIAIRMADEITYSLSQTQLPASIAELSNLEELYLYKNFLTHLPDELAALKKLQVLDIGRNLFNEVPDCIAGMVSLRQLYLLRNDIDELPEWLCNLKQLKTIDISDTPMVEDGLRGIPECLKSLLTYDLF